MNRGYSQKSIVIDYEEDLGKPSKPTNLVKSQTTIKDKKKLKTVFEPENWKEMWDSISEMRKQQLAPVDTMGSGCLKDFSASENEQAFQTLVSLMLSAQTKDEVTAATMKILLEKNLNIDMIQKTSEKELNELISSVGFHNKKAKYIKEATKIIAEQHKGIVPNNLKDLIALPGVGPKMAHLTLQISFGKVEGISVDTHVHRIANRLKWVKSMTSNPDQTASGLQEWLPKEYWGEINGLLVGFGQTVCKPIKPLCYQCKIHHYCPFTPKTKETKKKEDTIKQEDNVDLNMLSLEEKSEESQDQKSQEVHQESKAGEELITRQKKRKLDELEGFKFVAQSKTKRRQINGK